ncbi:hypothetical protein [Massilia consociata]|uniref:Uncharacterized protein n=1 Tax=Massilia consociata TaxID=760117 RepID=A0ABV6FKE4_9BURK
MPAFFAGFACLLGSLLLCAAAGAAQAAGAATELPAVRELDPVHVNAMRNPEVRRYKAILAGLDSFDEHRKMAPAVDRLYFRLEPRRKDELPGPPAARLVGDGGFTLPLPLDAAGRFAVPRSEAARDANSELELNKKRRVYRIMPDIRTPGLGPNQRRLGDLRLECKVMVAIAKEEAPWYILVAANGVLRTSDWCGIFTADKAEWAAHVGQPLREAVLREGDRSAALKVKGDAFEVALAEPGWSDEAVIELSFAEPLTGTAGETPRTAP